MATQDALGNLHARDGKFTTKRHGEAEAKLSSRDVSDAAAAMAEAHWHADWYDRPVHDVWTEMSPDLVAAAEDASEDGVAGASEVSHAIRTILVKDQSVNLSQQDVEGFADRMAPLVDDGYRSGLAARLAPTVVPALTKLRDVDLVERSDHSLDEMIEGFRVAYSDELANERTPQRAAQVRQALDSFTRNFTRLWT